MYCADAVPHVKAVVPALVLPRPEEAARVGGRASRGSLAAPGMLRARVGSMQGVLAAHGARVGRMETVVVIARRVHARVGSSKGVVAAR